MRASSVMTIAVVLYVISRWAHNKPALNVQVVVSGAFVILVISMLDQGQTEPIAKGLAWLFLVGAAYQAIPAISKASSAGQSHAHDKQTPASSAPTG